MYEWSSGYINIWLSYTKIPEKYILAKNPVHIFSKWGLNLKFKLFLYQLYSVSEIFHQEYTQLNSRVFVDGIKTEKIITIYLAIIFSYYYIINLDKVATN